ncbi:uncharacterized protein LOC131942377 [Physella acuta]|uniref:uncharacterized protein LOC131942377 n=1 Tax=Physella acuta TaxID=109671 RepID=UPI0027DD40AF|nr:uncharacterized protein LOC131942377 [Physella acuta]
MKRWKVLELWLLLHLLPSVQGKFREKVPELSSQCGNPVEQVVLATGQIKTTIANFTRTSWPDRNSSSTQNQPECSVWRITWEAEVSELVVLINGLDLLEDDVFYVTAERPSLMLRYDFNETYNHDPFPKEVRCKSDLYLVWLRHLGPGVNARKQRLAFSYIVIIDGASSTEEKERVILMGAIVISFFTVVATLLSISRSTNCRCWSQICGYFRSIKNSPTAPSGVGNRTDLSRRPEETILLMELHHPHRNAPPEYIALTPPGGSGGASTNQQQSSGTSMGDNSNVQLVSRQGANSSPQLLLPASPVPTDSAVQADSSDSRTNIDLVQQTERHTTDQSRHVQSLSDLLGILPPLSASTTPTTLITRQPPNTVSPFALVSSLFPSRQHPTLVASPMNLVQPHLRPSPHSPSEIQVNIGGHQVFRLTTGQQPAEGELPPPAYSEMPPPAYSHLFPARQT